MACGDKGLFLDSFTDVKAQLRLLRAVGQQVCSTPEFPRVTLRSGLHWIIQPHTDPGFVGKAEMDEECFLLWTLL